MQDDFIEYVRQPTVARFLAVRRRLLDDDVFDPDAEELTAAEELLLAGADEAAGNTLLRAMPHLILSPRAHWMLARIAANSPLPDADEAMEMESLLASLCIQGLLDAGRGDRSRPWPVTLFADREDVLAWLGKQPAERLVLRVDGRDLEQVRCDDGTEVWFDVHEPLARRGGAHRDQQLTPSLATAGAAGPFEPPSPRPREASLPTVPRTLPQ